MKILLPVFAALWLCSCANDGPLQHQQELAVQDTLKPVSDSVIAIAPKPDALEIFIDSMKKASFLLNPARLKQTIWSDIAQYKTTVDNGHEVVLVPFPLKPYDKYFSHPKTYFFAQWNEEKKTFKEGNDYLLMTWAIDSSGIRKEKDIYKALHDEMGNFPCYIFRSGNKVYAMANRYTVGATGTRILTEQLRNYIDPAAPIYKPFGNNDPR